MSDFNCKENDMTGATLLHQILPEAGRQSGGNQRPKKAHQVRSNVKMMTPAVWYTTSTHHRVKQPPKSTTGMSSVAYVILCGTRDRCCSQQVFGAIIKTMLQHIPRTWFKLISAKIYSPVVRQTSYSPDMAPCDIWMFTKLKRPLKGNLTRVLNTTSLKCCLPSTDSIDRREKFHASVWRFKFASCKRA